MDSLDRYWEVREKVAVALEEVLDAMEQLKLGDMSEYCWSQVQRHLQLYWDEIGARLEKEKEGIPMSWEELYNFLGEQEVGEK